mmetsp:Transcript_171224/g.548968  ORF Transcript_171224/g.548968 Transcript_171224/m.548968 type:complete len:825 (+) Transcript_171224:752-3226(+)
MRGSSSTLVNKLKKKPQWISLFYEPSWNCFDQQLLLPSNIWVCGPWRASLPCTVAAIYDGKHELKAMQQGLWKSGVTLEDCDFRKVDWSKEKKKSPRSLGMVVVVELGTKLAKSISSIMGRSEGVQQLILKDVPLDDFKDVDEVVSTVEDHGFRMFHKTVHADNVWRLDLSFMRPPARKAGPLHGLPGILERSMHHTRLRRKNVKTPLWSCPDEEPVGEFGETLTWVCGLQRLQSPCTVYVVEPEAESSFGSSMSKMTPCEVHLITSECRRRKHVTCHEAKKGEADAALLSLMREPGHGTVDVLKIDATGTDRKLMRLSSGDEFPWASVGQALIKVREAGSEAVNLLERHGFVVFHAETDVFAKGSWELSTLNRKCALHSSDSTTSDLPTDPVLPDLESSAAADQSAAGAGSMSFDEFAKLPFVGAYLSRGSSICKNIHQAGPDWQRATAVDAAYLQSSVLISARLRSDAGLGNILLELQVKIIAAWLTKMPIVISSNGGVFQFLQSRYLPSGSQITSDEVGFAATRVFGLSEKTVRKMLNATFDHSSLDCAANMHDPKSNVSYEVDLMQDAMSWGLPEGRPFALTRFRSKWNIWEAHTMCRTMLGSSASTAARVDELVYDRSRLQDCALRLGLERPTEAMLQVLAPLLRKIGDAALVSIHVRMGDAFLISSSTAKGVEVQLKHTWDRRFSIPRLNTFVELLEQILAELAYQVQPRRVVVFIAADTEIVTQRARAILKTYEVMENDGTSIHITHAHKAKPGDVIKIMADWYLLALSDILISPTHSSFSETAHMMGMQKFAILGRELEYADVDAFAQFVTKGYNS